MGRRDGAGIARAQGRVRPCGVQPRRQPHPHRELQPHGTSVGRSDGSEVKPAWRDVRKRSSALEWVKRNPVVAAAAAVVVLVLVAGVVVSSYFRAWPKVAQ